MCNAGFTANRAAKQAALAKFLEKICRDYLQPIDLRIVGSFSEGWGACFDRLDGTIGSGSDIDVTCLSGSRYHIDSLCTCPLSVISGSIMSRLINGHVEVAEYSESHPATAERGTQVRPDMDIAFANPCCRYPSPDFLSEAGYLPASMLSSIRAEMQRPWSCHLIRASSPGREAQQLRVSTTFLENAAMRSLSTVQGQVFLLIKYLIKRVIGRFFRGLKSYHAKTLVFRMLRCVEADRWIPENLEQLVRECLLDLLQSLNSSVGLLLHFFVPDSLVYLRKGCFSGTAAMAVRQTVQELRRHLIAFQIELKPIGEAAPFHLHPFRLIPLYFLEIPELAMNLEFHHIYLVVKIALNSFAKNGGVSQQVHDLIDRLPNAACTARQALKVLCALKEGQVNDAKRLLSNSFGEQPCQVLRAIPADLGCSVFDYLNCHDSAWQFSVRFEQAICLDWLPSSVLRNEFPARMMYYDKRFYLNFALLVNSLQLELLLSVGTATWQSFLDTWFSNIRSDPGCDFEELFTFSQYSNDIAQLRWIRDQMLQLSCYQTSEKFLRLTEKIITFNRR